MNKLLTAVVLIGTTVLTTACAEKKPLTPEEQWHGYCRSVGNAARSILLDRQNGITKEAAVEYASKLKDPTTKKFVDEQIEKVYALPESVLKEDKDKLLAKFKKEGEEACRAIPFDKDNMPDYKPF